MLKKNQRPPSAPLKPESKRETAGLNVAIVASEYNRRYVDGMLKAARAELAEAGCRKPKVFRTPGAFEIPAVVASLLRHSTPACDAVICLGVVIEGATSHARNICEAVTWSLAALQIEYGAAVIHEVLHLQNQAQAEARCLDDQYNRGREAARTALKMARLLNKLRGGQPASE